MVTERRSVRRPPRVERKIYFYRIAPISREMPITFNDIVTAMSQVNNLQWTSDGRYMEVADGNSVCMWCDQLQPQVRLKIGTRRITGLPDVEASGILTPLSIGSNEGLSELTHMIIFPDNTVGTEFNFFGPRVQRLKHYLDVKTNINSFKLQMLLQRDIERRLARCRDISLIHLRFKRTEAALLAEMAQGGLSGTFRGAAEHVDAPLIELIMRNEKYSKTPLVQSLFDSVKNLVRNSGSREILDIFEIKGFNEETHRPEIFDLLRDALISRKQVVRQGRRRRNINSESMYQAINDSYVELRDMIQSAAGLE